LEKNFAKNNCERYFQKYLKFLLSINLLLNLIKPYRMTGPVVIDVEKVTGADGRMNKISVEDRTRYAKIFCETVAKAGHYPMIYHNAEMGAMLLDLTQLEEYDKWYAGYSTQMFYPYEYKVWQYSATGKVPGISTDVDLNLSFAPIWSE
jgi:GH25 family lysozyme M1 (1,4-beta-N-acetylmuramidase)